MELSPDLSELLALFRAHRVECVVVGAHALAFYGAPRFTGDLDILVNAAIADVEALGEDPGESPCPHALILSVTLSRTSSQLRAGAG